MSRKQTSDFEKAEVVKELAFAMENIEGLKSELNTCLSRQKKTFDLEKA
jgi:hypothetical protein